MFISTNAWVNVAQLLYMHICNVSDDDDAKWCKDGWLPVENNSVDLLLTTWFANSKAFIGIEGLGATEFSPCCIAAGFLSEKYLDKIKHQL